MAIWLEFQQAGAAPLRLRGWLNVARCLASNTAPGIGPRHGRLRRRLPLSLRSTQKLNPRPSAMAVLALQWGRTQRSAETCRLWSKRPRHSSWLQWGRTQKSAETRVFAASTDWTIWRFNGAALKRVRRPPS